MAQTDTVIVLPILAHGCTIEYTTRKEHPMIDAHTPIGARVRRISDGRVGTVVRIDDARPDLDIPVMVIVDMGRDDDDVWSGILEAWELDSDGAAHPMKVRIEFTLDIDPEAWALEYGIDSDAEIRRDVRTHVENIVTEHLRGLRLLTERTR